MSSHPTTPVWLPWLYSRSIAIHLDGVDAALGPAPALQEGAVFHELQALACEVAALEDVYAEMFSMLQDPGRGGRKKEYSKSLMGRKETTPALDWDPVRTHHPNTYTHWFSSMRCGGRKGSSIT